MDYSADTHLVGTNVTTFVYLSIKIVFHSCFDTRLIAYPTLPIPSLRFPVYHTCSSIITSHFCHSFSLSLSLSLSLPLSLSLSPSLPPSPPPSLSCSLPLFLSFAHTCTCYHSHNTHNSLHTRTHARPTVTYPSSPCMPVHSW